MVKDEIFGTRPSLLAPWFRQHLRNAGVEIHHRIYLITCIRKHNCDPASRYLLVREVLCPDHNSVDGLLDNISRYRALLPAVRAHVPAWLIAPNPQPETEDAGFFHIDLRPEKSGIRWLSSPRLKAGLLKYTKCQYDHPAVAPKTKGRENTRFSRWFRGNMGAGFSMTDFDFWLVNPATGKALIVEEKVDPSHRIGKGQFLSMGEMQQDVLSEDCKIVTVFFPDRKRFVGHAYEFDPNHLPQLKMEQAHNAPFYRIPGELLRPFDEATFLRALMNNLN